MAKDNKNTGGDLSVPFYYQEFLADMLEHPPEIVGAWMLIQIKIWHAKRNGKITLTLDQYATLMHVTAGEADKYLDCIGKGIADVTRRNGDITVASATTQKEAKLLEQGRLRQQRYRESQRNNAGVTDGGSGPAPLKLEPLKGSLKFKKNVILGVLKKDHGICLRWFLSEFETQNARDRNTLEIYAKICTVLMENSNFSTWLHDTVADIARQQVAYPGSNKMFVKALNNKIEKTKIDRWVKTK